MDKRCFGACVSQHAEGQVETNGGVTASFEGAAEVAGSAGKVGNDRTGWQRKIAPAHI